MIFFESRINCRIRENDLKIIAKIVQKDNDKYDNISHFARVAVLKLMREECIRLNIDKKKADKFTFIKNKVGKTK